MRMIPYNNRNRLARVHTRWPEFEPGFSDLFRSFWGEGESEANWAPSMDVHEDKDQFIAKVEVPGMKKEDIDISLHDGSLSISGERKTDEKFANAEVYRAERFVGRFQRTITLPARVAAEKVRAEYKDGVLTVTLPKTEEAKPKRIDVQPG